jgi:hypothetical protein
MRVFTFSLSLHIVRTNAHTLVHGKAFPFVVSINASDLVSSSGVKPNSQASVIFGEHAFRCSPRMESLESKDAPPQIAAERLLMLQGVCLVVGTESFDKLLKVCIGENIYEFRRMNDGNPGIPRLLGTSDPQHNSTIHPWGIRETFQGHGFKAIVEYRCSRMEGVPITVNEVSKSILEVSIPTSMVCPHLTRNQRHGILGLLPRLSFISENRFWEYQFQFPNRAMQIHSDPTGATPYEIYSLGNDTNQNITFEISQSFDPDDFHVHPELQMWIVNGTKCDKHDLYRRTLVKFRCPSEWIEIAADRPFRGWTDYEVPFLTMHKKFKARLAQVSEPDDCEYVYTVESTALCLDKDLVPQEFETESATMSCLLEP